MIRLALLILLAQATVLGDGGTVQLRTEAAGLVITVFTSPSPLTAGPIDISVLMQKHDDLEPILDADVSILLRSASLSEIESRASRSMAQNKLFYAMPVKLPEPGEWNLRVIVLYKGQQTEATGTIHVAPPPNAAASYWGLFAFPPFMIALFLIRGRLMRRK